MHRANSDAAWTARPQGADLCCTVRSCSESPISVRPFKAVEVGTVSAEGEIFVGIPSAPVQRSAGRWADAPCVTQSGDPTPAERWALSRGRVLVVDDEEDVLALLRELLERAGFEVVPAGGGEAGLGALQDGPAPDLVILDVAMPGIDGWGVLERIRSASDVPVLMLTARTSELEKVRGLRAGADDYVAKPFGRQELLARIEALLRRTGGRARVEDAYEDVHFHVDFLQRRVQANGAEIALTPLEFRLLSALVRNAGKVLAHDQLLELVWRDSYGIAPEEVRTYVSYLRKKLREAGADADTIETVRGFGYRYRPPAG